ncbi:MAG: hypothetical protein AAB649_00025, partial [Patescibacteria group bacterium]
FELLEFIKGNKDLRDVRVIVISNLTNKEDMDRALELGAEYYFAKADTSTTEIVNKTHEILDAKKWSMF